MTERLEVLTVGPAEDGRRLDAFVAGRELGLTRSQAAKLTGSGGILVGGRPARAGRRLAVGERVEVSVPAGTERGPAPEAVPLDIVFEDGHLLVVNKPQGMVVHPGAGRPDRTLVNALLGHTQRLPAAGEARRPGIVHRLDRDTSGLMVVAKTEAAYEDLSRQVRDRELKRTYLALAWGRIREDRVVVNVPIGRQLRDRKRMAAVAQPEPGRQVRSAATEIRVLSRFQGMTLVEARLKTGRTHQIRVHLAHVGHPVVGDRTYGLRKAGKEKATLGAETLARVAALPGQALHAQSVVFRHPETGQRLSFSVSPPGEMSSLLAYLRGKLA